MRLECHLDDGIFMKCKIRNAFILFFISTSILILTLFSEYRCYKTILFYEYNFKNELAINQVFFMLGFQYKQNFDECPEKRTFTDKLEIQCYPKNAKNYIILYLLEPFNDKISEILLKVKSAYNLPIVYIAFSNSKKKNVDYHLTNVTPERFVCLINNSDLVLTDSFHGTAFSVNLNKNFISILNPSNPKRVEDFLTLLGLEENIYNEEIKKNTIDYKKINTKIESIRKESIEFLKQNL